jgi:hypothetical protein
LGEPRGQTPGLFNFDATQHEVIAFSSGVIRRASNDDLTVADRVTADRPDCSASMQGRKRAEWEWSIEQK